MTSKITYTIVRMRNTIRKGHMLLAEHISKLSQCKKKKVGAVLYSEAGIVLAVGFNEGNCTADTICIQKRLELKCMAEHAEVNAVKRFLCDMSNFKQRSDEPDTYDFIDEKKPHTCVVTLVPCLNCLKTLSAIGIRTVVYRDDHTHTPDAIAFCKEHHMELDRMKSMLGD